MIFIQIDDFDDSMIMMMIFYDIKKNHDKILCIRIESSFDDMSNLSFEF